MKELFEKPELEIIMFATSDVMTISIPDDGEDDPY